MDCKGWIIAGGTGLRPVLGYVAPLGLFDIGAQVKQLYDADHKSKWFSPEDAMKKLGIKSKTTM
jgi:hypothetical protein